MINASCSSLVRPNRARNSPGSFDYEDEDEDEDNVEPC